MRPLTSRRLDRSRQVITPCWSDLASDATNSGLQSELDALERQSNLAGGSVVASDDDQVTGPIEQVEENVMTKRRAGVFFSIYYCMTGVHAIHILGGIACSGLAARSLGSPGLQSSILWPGRLCRSLLALGRLDLDLPVPAAVLDSIEAFGGIAACRSITHHHRSFLGTENVCPRSLRRRSRFRPSHADSGVVGCLFHLGVSDHRHRCSGQLRFWQLWTLRL